MAREGELRSRTGLDLGESSRLKSESKLRFGFDSAKLYEQELNPAF